MRLSAVRIVSAAVVPIVFLAGCGSSTDAEPSPLDVVTVGGTDKAPTLLLKDKPLSVKATTTKVVTPGKGPVLTKANGVKFSYLLANGKDAKPFDTNFGKGTAGMFLSSSTLIPGLSKGVTGQKVGSRLLVAVPPADAFGAQGGIAEKGVGPTDTILFLIDVVSAMTPLTTAEGTAVPPKAGLPTVKMQGVKAAQITVPKAAAPPKLVVQPLIKGTGPVVKSGQQMKVSYTGVLWKNGKKFDSSADHARGFDTPIGVGQVIPAWDKSLIGLATGSRVLMVVPPADGYGASGSKGIGPKDTLVYVIDILASI